jgi:hypothetical protein
LARRSVHRTSAILGIADPDHLGGIAVPVTHELRGVGKNMQNHYVARVSYRSLALRRPMSAHAARH